MTPSRPRPHGLRLARNSVFVGLGQATVLLLLAVHILSARVLGDEAFGVFALGLAITRVLATVATWGTSRYSAITAARDPRRTAEVLADNLGVTLPLSALYVAGVAATAWVVRSEVELLAVSLILAVDSVAHATSVLLRLLFRVHDRYPLETATALVERILILLLAGAVLALHPGVVALASAFAIGRASGTLATAWVYRRRVGPLRVRFAAATARRLLSAGTPIALRGTLGGLSFRADTLLLGALRPAAEVGWYGAAYRLMDGIIMLPLMVTGALGPTLSASFGLGESERVRRLYRRGFKYLLVAGLFLAVTLGALAGPVVELLYGADYRPAAPALRILSIAVVFLFLRQLAIEVLDNVDLRGTAAAVFGASLVVNVGLNALAIPRWGALGAAATTVVTEAFGVIAMTWILRGQGYTAGVLSRGARPVGAAILAGGVMLLLEATPVLALAAGGLTYVLALAAMRTWDATDAALAGTILARARSRMAFDRRSPTDVP